MLRNISLFILICGTIESLISQDSMHYHFPDGIYHSLEDFRNKNPDTSIAIRKLNFMLPTDQAFKDTLVDQVWFIDKNNDRIEKVFAVVKQGEIYLHEYAMKRHAMPDFRKPAYYNKYKLHRVHIRGNYFYGVRKYMVSNSSGAILLGSQYGAIGGLLGALMDSGTYTGMYAENPFVLDYRSGKFLMVSTKGVLKQFMNTFYPENQFEPPKGKMEMEDVRQLFISLNSR